MPFTFVSFVHVLIWSCDDVLAAKKTTNLVMNRLTSNCPQSINTMRNEMCQRANHWIYIYYTVKALRSVRKHCTGRCSVRTTHLSLLAFNKLKLFPFFHSLRFVSCADDQFCLYLAMKCCDWLPNAIQSLHFCYRRRRSRPSNLFRKHYQKQ